MKSVLALLLAMSGVVTPIAQATEAQVTEAPTPQTASTVLPAAVQRALNVRKVPPETLSVYAIDVDTGSTLLEWRAEEPRNPASTVKLLTTLVALDVLGPAYRWKTEVFIDGDVQDGRLDGDLILKGYGDPFLVTERVWQLQRDIRRAGIRDIAGDLALDDSWFRVGDYDPGAFDNQPLRAYNVAPNALLTNFNVVRYWFEPDPEAAAVKVRLDPPLYNLSVDNRLKLGNRRCAGFQRGIAIALNKSLDEVRFSGSFPNGCRRYAMDRTALSHNEFTYGLFSTLWRDAGGALDGTWHKVVVEEEAEPLLTFSSQPLSEVIARVNKHSNNVMARHLLYTLGAETGGAPGTERGGIAAIEQWLQAHELASESTVLANGAGLSRTTRLSARTMGAMLQFAWDQPYMPEYLASMSLSGLDGTLRRRFGNTRLVGQAHLKTGSLDHVTAIAGYLQSRSGRRFAVVAMQNHDEIHRGPGEEVQEALLRWLYEQ